MSDESHYHNTNSNYLWQLMFYFAFFVLSLDSATLQVPANLYYYFGMNPADKIVKKFEELLTKKTGIPNITFKQVHAHTYLHVHLLLPVSLRLL